MATKTTVVLFWNVVFYACLAHANPCMKQSFDHCLSFVCVCNETYCDDVIPDVKQPDGVYSVYTTSEAGDRLAKRAGRFYKVHTDFHSPQENPDVLYQLDPTVTKQTIVGFGGTFSDASGINIAGLPEGAQKNFIESYFGPSGIGYTLARIPIASNDMSADVYSYDFTPGDTGLSKFTIAGYDHQYKIPYITKAWMARQGNLSLFASPWASPRWMKTNDNMVGFGTILPEMMKVYANYLSRFIPEYTSFMFGPQLWAITTQNGPTRSCSNDSTPEYQSVCWSPHGMKDWVVKDLKRSLIDYGYPNVKIFTMDDSADVMNEWRQAFQDANATSDIDGFAVHGYKPNDSSAMDSICETFRQHPNKTILGSEYCQLGKPLLGNWGRAVEFAERIFDNLDHCVSSFTHYDLAVDMSGGPSWVDNYADAPVIVDNDQKVFYKQPTFYMMGHFSKFVPPGAVAISLIPLKWSTETQAVGFTRPDNSTVVVVGNFNDHVTSVGLLVGNYYANYTMDANSISTFTWWKTQA